MNEQELNDKWNFGRILEEKLKTLHNTPAPETLKKFDELNKRMDDNYSKRELDEHFKDLKESVGRVETGVLNLNTKVGIQNGRVTKNESFIKGLTMVGGVALFLVGIIMSLIVYSFKISQENLKNSILLELSQQ